MQQDNIYIDNNATTKVDEDVFRSMKPFLKDWYGNPSSMYSFGGKIREYVDIARKQVANLIGAEPEEIIFTSCGTESDNTAVFSALDLIPERKKIVISKVEHPAIFNFRDYLRKRGYQVQEIPVDSKGRIDIEDVKSLVDNNTALVSVMWANNELGNIYPIKEISEIAKSYGAFFHTDAVQAVGKIPVNVKDTMVDMLSLSGHKIHAPKGVGALYKKKETELSPYMIGGHQEFGLRAGTENVAGIVALGKACEVAQQNMDYENNEVKKMRDYLEKQILEKISDTLINGDPQKRVPNTTNIGVKFIEGESILLLLDRYNISASTGSACATGSLEISHVLKAIGASHDYAHGSLRMSLSKYNTMEEIEYIIDSLVKVVEKLRSISPFGN